MSLTDHFNSLFPVVDVFWMGTVKLLSFLLDLLAEYRKKTKWRFDNRSH